MHSICQVGRSCIRAISFSTLFAPSALTNTLKLACFAGQNGGEMEKQIALQLHQQSSTEWDGEARNGTAKHGMGRRSTEWDGEARNGTAKHGMGRAQPLPYLSIGMVGAWLLA